jgi:hypothetical protein
MKAVGRAGAAAGRTSGAIIPCAIGLKRSPNAKDARTGDGPAKGESLQDETRYRLVVEAEPLKPTDEEQGGTVFATTVGAEVGSDAQLLQVYQEQNSTVEPG